MTNINKSVKLQAKEDRISDLPDSLIQHILSLLPSTKEAIQTTLLSKRWKNQWTRVPVLSFHSFGMSTVNYSRFIDNALLLHRCSKIQKFYIEIHYYFNKAKEDPNWIEKIHFAMRKNVKELIVDSILIQESLKLSEFFYYNASLVKLKICNCDLVSIPNWRLSWENLKALNIKYCTLPDQAIENILRGSPLLESMKITCYSECREPMVIASKSLKKLVLRYYYSYILQISCPNLEEFKLFGEIYSSFIGFTLMYLPSLIHATLDFDVSKVHGDYNGLQIIKHLQHANDLKFGSYFIKTLSEFELRSSLLLNTKSLTLASPNFEMDYVGIACALHNFDVLEKFVIQLKDYHKDAVEDSNLASKNYWNSNRTVFNCLVSHLKIIEINGLSETDCNLEHVLNLVEFLLKNAAVLQKLVVLLKGGGKDFVISVSQKLLNLWRCSQHATVEMLYSN